ncbi:MAG: hypothetical protein IH988_10595 [Planctomycetes bacterium]|nr:hypothetical protein [Planctomycetota bacterium]
MGFPPCRTRCGWVDGWHPGGFEEFQSEHDIHLLAPVHYRHLPATSGFQILGEFPQGRTNDPLTTDDWIATYLVA